MTRTLLVAALAIAFCAAASADVTLRSRGTAQGLGMSGEMDTTTYIKGLRMRVDTQRGKKSESTIFDVENQKMYVLDAKKRQVEVWDMATLSQEISNAVSLGEMQTSMKPNGQKKAVAGLETEGYDIDIVLPATIGGAGGMPVTLRLTGTTWVARGAPGAADYAGFYQGAAEKGWIFNNPRAAKGAPGQAKAMAQMYAELARTGGIALETQMNIRTEGDSPMAALMARMGGVSTSDTVQAVETGALGDELFVPPPDYQLKQRE